MKKINAPIVISTLALAVAATGTASATGLIDGHSIKDRSIPASKLMLKSITTKQVKPYSLTKLALDPNAVTVVNNINAPAGPKGDDGSQGPAVVGAPGAPGVNGTAKAFAFVNSTSVISNDSGNVTLTHPAVGTWCVTAPGTIAVVSIANSPGLPAGGGNARVTNPSHLSCGDGAFEVQTVNSSNVATDLAFNIITA